MKTKYGKVSNLAHEVLGKITFSDKLYRRSDYIRVGHDIKKTPRGYAATITDKKDTEGHRPLCIVDNIDDINEGDVVLINKDGSIAFLFEIKSHMNVIMATGKCNHRCIMCAQPPVDYEVDKTKFNLKLITLCDKDACEIGISGGEPTIIGDKLFVLIRQIKKNMPKAAISILSNGVKFANKEYAMKLAMCHHHDLQIDIPLFSDIAELHNHVVGAQTFYKTVQGLYNLALFQQRIGIRVVVHKQTYKRLPQLADFIYHNFPFISQVAFMQMENIGYAQKNMDDLWIDPYEYNKELKEAVYLLSERGVDTYIYNSQLCILPPGLRSYAIQSISDWKDIYLEECEGCTLRGQCAGFFASNKNFHSKHIKKQLGYTPLPEPTHTENIGDNTSKFLKENFSIIEKYISKDSSIYDVPSGYGRNAIWLANKAYRVSCFDIDSKANKWLTQFADTHNFPLMIFTEDILSMHVQPCQLLINVHLYSPKIIKKLLMLISKGGGLLLETPELHGMNFTELPYVGELKGILEKEFEVIIYQESNEMNGHCAVKLFAIKR
jgi:His-Xaa-Ser system radical SAM maturase HxsC